MNEKKKEERWLKNLLSYAKGHHYQIIISIILSVISVISGLIPYFCVYKVINDITTDNYSLEIIGMWMLFGVLGYLIKTVFFTLSTGISHSAAYHILENLRLRTANVFLHAPLGSVQNHSIGEIKGVMMDKIENIEPPLAHMFPEGIGHLMLPIISLIALSIIDIRIMLCSLITIPIGAILMGMTAKKSAKNFDKYNESNKIMNSTIVEYVEGIQVIKAFGKEGSCYEKFAKAITSYRTFVIKWLFSTMGTMKLCFAVFPSTILGILPMALYLASKGVITPAQGVLSVILSLSMVTSLGQVEVFIEGIRELKYTLRDINTFLDIKPLQEPQQPAILKGTQVELHHVCFSYTGKKEDEVLHGIDLTLKQGTFTALVGTSGGGKSTVAKLISRFWDVTEGEILIGGVNIKHMTLKQLSDQVSFVTQDNFLFRCSLMENIRLGNPNASDEEVYQAAKLARCDEFIRLLPKGYNTPAGEAGKRLSGGEKQRIAIARMILKNAPIVILDEATAFTDPESEHIIQQSIASLVKGKTLLVIAHRLSTIQSADQIVVLQDGRILAKGLQGELLKNCKTYQNMWRAHIGSKNWAVSTGRRGEISHV